MPSTSDQRTPLERILSAVTEVHAGEGITALLLSINLFLLLTAYYVIKPVRAALILALDSGAEYKSYMSAAIAVALLIAVPIYSRVASKLKRNRLVVGVTLFFVTHLVLFYVASLNDSIRQDLALPFFLWVGIFNMMVVAQFWAFANDLYTEEQGKRLFALVGLGASTGAAFGAGIAKFLIPLLGVYQMLLVCAVILATVAGLTHVVHMRESHRQPATKSDTANAVETPKDADDDSGAFAMVAKHRYLMLLAAFSLLFTLINTNGEYILDHIVSEAANAAVGAGEIAPADKKAWIGAWYGDFFLYVSVLGILLQTFVVSRVVKWGGLKWALLAFPVIAMLDAAALFTLPLLLTVRVGKTVENATDYSLNNTARNMLWLPTTRAMKYKAKQAVDTFFVRMGDVGSAALVWLLAGQLKLSSPRIFAGINVVLGVVLVALSLMIIKEQRALKATAEQPPE
jgi:ATP:ADP antiporter, AAA family